jgi:hypothetical protein
LAAAQCEKASWVVDDDGVAGVVSREGKPLKHAKVRLFSAEREYSAITDDKGWFSIWPVALGQYSFTVKGWGDWATVGSRLAQGRNKSTRPSLH